MKKIIKHRLFTWFEETENPAIPSGPTVMTERIAHFGDDVDLPDAAIKRGESLDAFFSDKEAKAIRTGTYNGPQADLLARFRGGQAPAPGPIEPLEGEGPQTEALTSDELGEYIVENKLNVDATVALATDGDTDSIQKVYDAEVHAASLKDADPRKGVTDRLDAMLNAAAQGEQS